MRIEVPDTITLSALLARGVPVKVRVDRTRAARARGPHARTIRPKRRRGRAPSTREGAPLTFARRRRPRTARGTTRLRLRPTRRARRTLRERRINDLMVAVVAIDASGTGGGGSSSSSTVKRPRRRQAPGRPAAVPAARLLLGLEVDQHVGAAHRPADLPLQLVRELVRPPQRGPVGELHVQVDVAAAARRGARAACGSPRPRATRGPRSPPGSPRARPAAAPRPPARARCARGSGCPRPRSPRPRPAPPPGPATRRRSSAPGPAPPARPPRWRRRCAGARRRPRARVSRWPRAWR